MARMAQTVPGRTAPHKDAVSSLLNDPDWAGQPM